MKKMIGDLVRFHRKKADLSQKELAELAEVGKTVIFDLEKSKTNFRIETLMRVFNVLNIKLNFNSPIIDIWRKQYEKNSS